MRLLAAAVLIATSLLGFSALAQPVDEQGLVIAGQDAVPEVAVPDGPLLMGVRTRSEPMSQYEGTTFWQAGRPVGYLEVVARGGLTQGPRTIPCTAWLVGPDVIMTAWHCLPGLPREARDAGWTYASATVKFDFDDLQSPGSLYMVGSIIEANAELDYALARLRRSNLNERPPGEIFGVIRVARQMNPAPGTPLFMVHHAYGYSKLLLKDSACRVFGHPSGSDQFLYHRCDTRGGSSGAPVLLYQEGESQVSGARSFLAVGLHSTGAVGGLANDDDSNIAVSLSSIIEASEYLSAVACQPDFGRPYCPDIASVAPTPQLIYFDFDRSDLSMDAQQAVRSLAQQIASDPGVTHVLVVGHSDPNDGSAAYTQGLSHRRAKTVADALISMGVDSSLITVDGRGETQPLTNSGTNSDPLNRRVEITIKSLPES